jgi:branched-chain amino acid transport system substrate-binding protein
MFVKHRRTTAFSVPAAALALVLLAAGCTSKGSTSGTTAAGGVPTAGQTVSKCGLGNGQKAAGTPIKLGAVITDIPGLGFTDSSAMGAAYYKCVNDNGGINGRPIDFTVEKDALDPQQTASLATKLLDTTKVDAMVGSFSVLDCSVNEPLYAKAGFSVINIGSSLECFNSPVFAPDNDGPSFSALATAQYLLSKGAKSLVIFTSNTPGSDAINQGVVELAKKAGVPVHASLVSVPISDPTSLTLQAVQQAGSGGGIVVNVNPGEAIKVFNVAQQQGLVDKVKWGCPAGCNDAAFVKQLSSVWDGKLGVNAEVNLQDSTGPDNLLYRQVQRQYASSTPIDNFGQLGFLAARIAVQSLLATPADSLTTRAGVNAALKATKEFKSDLYCRPWYFGDQKFHAANNVTRTVTPQKGVYVLAQDCTPIPALPNNNFDAIRQYEQTFNGG